MIVTIARLGHLGDGIAPGPIYAPLTLPGEEIEGAPEAGRIAAPRILTPSADRVRPACRHFRACGGCALQHASDRFVADWKADVVRHALAAQGLPAPIRRVSTSPPASRRRAMLAGRRTKKGAIVGFHGRASDMIAEVPDCKVLRPEIRALLPSLAALTAQFASRKGEIGFAVTWSEAGADLAVSGGKPLDGPRRLALAEAAAAAGLARLSWEGETVVERAPPVQRFGGIAVVPPPGAFLQATAAGEDALRAAVDEAVGESAQIADLFAGCGTFALPLATRAAVHAVEATAEMLAAVEKAWRAAPGLKQVTTETRDLFRRPLLPDELARFGAAVIDPPRAGADAQTRELARSVVPRIAALSCNPVTFAHDARILTDGGYRRDWIDVVDQFRWSPHIELAASFRRDPVRGDRT